VILFCRFTFFCTRKFLLRWKLTACTVNEDYLTFMRMLKFCATPIISQLAYIYGTMGTSLYLFPLLVAVNWILIFESLLWLEGLTMKKLLSLIIKYAILEALICALVVMIRLSIKLWIFLLRHGLERITTILGSFPVQTFSQTSYLHMLHVNFIACISYCRCFLTFCKRIRAKFLGGYDERWAWSY